MARPLVSGFVFLNDRCRNTAALADLVAALAGPLPDFRAALTARPATRLPPACRTADTAGMLYVSTEDVVQFLCMRGTEVDLVRGAVDRERNSLAPVDLAVVRQITNYRYYGLLHHQAAAFH